jgi:hypothetical protein
MGVLMAQFGIAMSGCSTETAATNSSSSKSGMFNPADWGVPKNASIPDDISAITSPLLEKSPQTTMNDIMSHGSLRYEYICMGNKGVCLNFNMLGVCNDKSCTYQHVKANPMDELIKAAAIKLGPAIQGFIADGRRAPKKQKTGSS